MMKRIAAFLLAAALIAMFTSACAGASAESSSKTNTSVVTRGNLQIGLTADGRVALPVTNLDFGVDGTVKKIYAAVGDMVKAGDLLAELDDTDYQLEITNAQNNLDRAKVAYTDAVNQYEYSLKSSEYNLDSTKRDLNKSFDSYSYQNAIMEAQKTLEKKQTELAEAIAAAAKPFDSYSYQNKIIDAEQALAKKQEELADAQKDAGNYDSYSDMQTISDAETKLQRAQTTLANTTGDITKALQDVEDAQKALDKAWNDHYRNVNSANEKSGAAVKTAVEAVEKAQQDLERAKTDLTRAETQAAEDAATKVKNAQSAVADAESSLAKAKNDLARAQSDYASQRVSTQNTYDLQNMSLENQKSSTTTISNAELNVAEAELKLQEAINKLEKTKVYASKDGKIISITLSEGEQAKANSNSSAAIINFGTGNSSNSFMTLCDVAEIYLTASISEGDIVGLTVDQILKVTIDSIGEQEFSGYIYNIDSLPTTDMSSGITTYTVTCKLDIPNTDIKDGMNALIVFIKKERNDVLLVPNKAVFIENNTQYVNVEKDDGTFEKREVVCALSNGTLTEVASGLSEGEKVAVGAIK